MLKWRAKPTLTDEEKIQFFDDLCAAVNQAVETNNKAEPVDVVMHLADKVKPIIRKYIDVIDDTDVN